MRRALRTTPASATSRVGRYVPAPPVKRLTPPTREQRRQLRCWASVDARSVAAGRALSVFAGRVLVELSTRIVSGRGRPAINREFLLLCVPVGVMDGRSYRNLEGHVAQMLVLVGIDEDLAPDHSSFCRFIGAANYDTVKASLDVLRGTWRRRRPARGETVTIAIDATGFALSCSGGWAADKPGSTDRRRGRYDKFHAACDVETHELVAWSRTASQGRGTGDVSRGPPLLDEAAAHGWTFDAICADGAYTALAMFDAADAQGAHLLVPLADHTVYGRSQSRNELLTQQCGEAGDGGRRRRDTTNVHRSSAASRSSTGSGPATGCAAVPNTPRTSRPS